MRAVLLLIIVGVLLPFCVTRPHIGAYVWAWISFMNPHKLAWGMQDLPVAEWVGVATIIGFLFSSLARNLSFAAVLKGGVGLITLWLLFTATTPFAIFPDKASLEWERISKILLMTFVTLLVIVDRDKLRNLVKVTALSLGFYGLKGGIFSILSGGNYRIFGPEDSFIFDNNALALALCMNLPLLYYLWKDEDHPAHRVLLKIIFFLSIPSIIFSYSRGGFLTLLAVGLLLLWRSSEGPKKILAILVLMVLALPLGLAVIPDGWFSRISSIKDYDQDLSALGRINAWKLSWRIALDRPFTGGGFGVTDDESIYNLYYPDSPTRTGVHSIYFQVLGSSGFIGFGIFVTVIASMVLSMRRLRREHSGSADLKWISEFSQMVETSLIGYAVGGAFLELATFDLFYHILGIGIILKHEARKAAHQSILPSILPSIPHPSRYLGSVEFSPRQTPRTNQPKSSGKPFSVPIEQGSSSLAKLSADPDPAKDC